LPADHIQVSFRCPELSSYRDVSELLNFHPGAIFLACRLVPSREKCQKTCTQKGLPAHAGHVGIAQSGFESPLSSQFGGRWLIGGDAFNVVPDPLPPVRLCHTPHSSESCESRPVGGASPTFIYDDIVDDHFCDDDVVDHSRLLVVDDEDEETAKRRPFIITTGV
jgi:hypothetical protein